MTLPRPAALFDMDRTLVRVNTGQRFVKFQRSQGKASAADVVNASWVLFRYVFGVLDMEELAKTAAASQAGLHEQEFRDRVRAWVQQDVFPHISRAARDAVAHAKQQGRPCAILTTATSYVAGPVAEELGIEHVLATRVEVANGLFTGRLVPPLCYGANKIVVAETWAQQHGVDLGGSSFFSDSISDLPMLERVGEPHVVNPDPRLRWVARRRGWPVHTW